MDIRLLIYTSIIIEAGAIHKVVSPKAQIRPPVMEPKLNATIQDSRGQVVPLEFLGGITRTLLVDSSMMDLFGDMDPKSTTM